MKKTEFFSFCIVLIILLINVVNLNVGSCNSLNARVKADSLWADSVLNTLSLDEKIAQLMFIRTFSNKSQIYYDGISEIIKKYNIGGLIFFQGGPLRQARLTNKWQSEAKVPLLISIDGEWGLGMRLDSIISFPFQMTLGAIQDDTLIYRMGAEIAYNFKQLGVHINFAPVIDVNSNPRNPVINYRSFGEDRQNVAKKGCAYMKGMQDNGIIATGKHFPGHGDTDTDSHKTLPVIKHTKERIDSVDLYPFKYLINRGLDGVMIAHLFIPELDNTENLASTLSKPIVTDLLKNTLNFDGLVITDGLGMLGVAKYNEPGILEVNALIAGNDILLLPSSVPVAINAVKKAIKNNLITIEIINKKCKKVLRYKYYAGLAKNKPIEYDDLNSKLNSPKHEAIVRTLYESSITLVKNENNIIPIKAIDTLKLASVAIGVSEKNDFQRMMSKYTDVDHYVFQKSPSYTAMQALIKQLQNYHYVIVGIHNTSTSSRNNYGITQKTIDFITLLKRKKRVIVDIFANPYSLARFEDDVNIDALIVSYQDNKYAEEASAQAIFGGIGISGKLPVTASKKYPLNTGLETKKNRLQFSIPEQADVSSELLKKVDSLALLGVKEKAFPGCQILAAKDGKIFYHKSFGFHTYSNKTPVKNSDIYDLASVTKIAATTISIMKLSDEGKVDIDQKLKKYLPYLDSTDKQDIIIREMMAHQSRLTSWIPFYLKTIHKGKLDANVYSNVQAGDFSIRVADNLFMIKGYVDTIYKRIITSKLRKMTEYLYSDVGFYLLKDIVNNTAGQTLDNYVSENFYKPLGLRSICFNPLECFNVSQIVPTENDTFFRKQLLQGYVHDMGAAMLGGVSGHAGLFSNTYDLSVILQMLLQKGEYGGEKFIEPATVKEFTKQQFPLNENRRGIGFDKPLNDYQDNGPTCKSVSAKSFGHSGFTGTYIWADPKTKLLYVFLSNRVHPDAENKTIYQLNTRTEIHQAFYDAIYR